MQRTRRTASLLLALTTSLLAASGCRVSNDDIDAWKGTRKGPGKMVAVMLASKFDVALRTYAAISLVEMERQDVDGVAEVQRAVQKLDEQARGQIVDGLAEGLIGLMKKAPSSPSGDGAPPPYQVRAKDAGFLLVSSASPEMREKLTRAVVSWYTDDFNGRSLSGNFSAEQVVRGLGASAAKSLVDALSAQLPQQALVKLAELIGQLGDAGAKQRAGQRLVQIGREMEGQAFLDWLRGQIATQMKESNTPADPARVQKAAELNRQNFIENGVLPAMKYLADQPEVAARLLEIASTKDDKLAGQRTRALQALEGKAHASQLDALLAIALDEANPTSVRDYAFDRVGDIRSARAIPPMWGLVQNAEEQRLRWRAGELVLAIGGAGVLPELLGKLPAGGNFEPEELDGYAQRMAQMSPEPRETAASLLRSGSWWQNVIGLHYFQRKGTEADVPAMTALTRSGAQIDKGKHWEKGDTLGKVAERAIAGLRERLKEASSAGAQPAPAPK